jgi:hypothetical protein
VRSSEIVAFESVEGVSETVNGLLCRIGARRLEISPRLLEIGSEVRKPGDRGRLVLARWVAESLGLAARD